MKIEVLDQRNGVLADAQGEGELNLYLEHEFEKGDHIRITGLQNQYVWITLDETLGETLTYVTGTMDYQVPIGERKDAMSPLSFTGERHNLCLRIAEKSEIVRYQNLAYNCNDQHENIHTYPHASANVETRGEAVFEARNAIDGITANHGHGFWPFSSWGINCNPDATLHISFGRTVLIDELVFYLRADFPHDNWWEAATVIFSDGSRMTISLKKTDQGQHFSFEKKEITGLTLCELKKSPDESPFPALTQLKVMGWNLVQ